MAPYLVCVLTFCGSLLPAQVVTLIVWCSGRFFLYTSYFTIFGALFGAANFGRMVAIDNSINGIVGLLQFPFTAWGLHGLHGNFTAINMIQVGHPARCHQHLLDQWSLACCGPSRPGSSPLPHLLTHVCSLGDQCVW